VGNDNSSGKGQVFHDALGQAVSGPTGIQQEMAEGKMGPKITLLAYVMKHGPYALASFALTLALVYVGDVLLQRMESDRDLSVTLIKSNVTLADSVGRMAGSSEQLLSELKGFTSVVHPEHEEMTHILREHTSMLQQLLHRDRQ